MPPRPLQLVREAAIDGRAQNYYYRQTQLHRLHGAFARNAAAIQSAIAHDAECSLAEAQLEFVLAMSCIKTHYAGIDPEEALEEEYSVARGVDAPLLREGVGLVYIQPGKHSLFYSVVSPLAAAIAAGNCIVVQLENTLRSVSVPSVLRKLLKEGLDPDTIEIVSSPPSEDQLGSKFIQVLQDGSAAAEGSKSIPKANQLISPSNACVVAVVDRTADLQAAAKALVTARFSFGGRSPYAPDLILVNEFARKRFLDAVVEESIRFMTSENLYANGSANGSAEKDGRRLGSKDPLEDIKNAEGVRVITSGANGAILEVDKRSSTVLQTKITGKALLVHSIRSLDDAIDIANTTTGNNAPLLANYVFADAKSAKYLAQFISSPAAFVNQVPLELLIGPAAPTTTAVPLNPALRYPAELFSTPKPNTVKPSQQTVLFTHALISGAGSSSSSEAGKKAADAVLQRALADATKELVPKKPRKAAGQIGFFEQGILTGLGIFLVPTLVTLVTAGYFGVRAVKSRFL